MTRMEIMRIGLIADTHIPRDAKMLPPHVKEAFKGVDLILHAGDIYQPAVLDELETIAPVLAALGNGDIDFPPDPRLKESQVIDVIGLKLWLTHAISYPRISLSCFDEAVGKEVSIRPDIIVFGDTHVAMMEMRRDVLLVNPGSPTLPNGLFELGTVGLMEITNKNVEIRIVQLSEFHLTFQRDLVYRRGYGA